MAGFYDFIPNGSYVRIGKLQYKVLEDVPVWKDIVQVQLRDYPEMVWDVHRFQVLDVCEPTHE